YLKQVVIDGFVHADPHPGNVHLMKGNKIALMDLGMVAQFTPQMQEYLMHLLIALSKNNGEEISDILLDMSDQESKEGYDEFRRHINTMVMDSRNSTAKDMQTGRLLIQMNRSAAQNGLHLPVEINILGKV